MQVASEFAVACAETMLSLISSTFASFSSFLSPAIHCASSSVRVGAKRRGRAPTSRRHRGEREEGRTYAVHEAVAGRVGVVKYLNLFLNL